MSLLVAILVSLVYFHFSRFYQGPLAGFLKALGWILVVANLLRAALRLAYELDRQPFRILEMGLEGDQRAPGEAFRVRLRMAARRRETLRQLTVELRCTRQTQTQFGRQRSVLHSLDQILARDLKLEAGDERDLEAELAVPKEAPFSFRSMESKIRWEILVVVELERWGKLEDTLEVMVSPSWSGAVA